jgi:hypothetical protein
MGKEHMQLYEETVEVPDPLADAVSQAAKFYGIVVVLGVNERDLRQVIGNVSSSKKIRSPLSNKPALP